MMLCNVRETTSFLSLMQNVHPNWTLRLNPFTEVFENRTRFSKDVRVGHGDGGREVAASVFGLKLPRDKLRLHSLKNTV